ncbi:hypothetical protein C1646_757190 [Rhizophagus diaphanus]|nr:hypothetical protein C1646_757190 [Rhizophagus diaphanus] [Rhizophagus sp. MUCL 43196]
MEEETHEYTDSIFSESPPLKRMQNKKAFKSVWENLKRILQAKYVREQLFVAELKKKEIALYNVVIAGLQKKEEGTNWEFNSDDVVKELEHLKSQYNEFCYELLTNRFGMSFGIFTGVNNHGQSFFKKWLVIFHQNTPNRRGQAIIKAADLVFVLHGTKICTVFMASNKKFRYMDATSQTIYLKAFESALEQRKDDREFTKFCEDNKKQLSQYKCEKINSNNDEIEVSLYKKSLLIYFLQDGEERTEELGINRQGENTNDVEENSQEDYGYLLNFV